MRPDPLTPAERAEVEARIAARDVTVLPPGGTAQPYPIWDGQKLVMPERPNPFRAGMNQFHGKNSTYRMRRQALAPQPLSAAVIARREIVARLHADGKSVPEMVAAIRGSNQAAIRHDLAKMGLSLVPAARPNAVDREDRARRVRDMVARGMVVQDIAAALALSLDFTRRLVKSLGFAPPRKNAADRYAGQKPLADRCIAAAAAHFGLSVAELSRKDRQPGKSHPRFAVVMLLRDLDLPYRAIGVFFGGRDSTAVGDAYHRGAALCATDPKFAADVAALRAKLAFAEVRAAA